MRQNFSAYHAMYIALAECLALPLLTHDRKFAASPGHTADVHRFPDLTIRLGRHYPARTTTWSAWRITAGSCVAQITVWPSS